MNKKFPTWPASSRGLACQVENNHINRCWYWPLYLFWDYDSVCFARNLFETLSFHIRQMPLYRTVVHLSLRLKIRMIFYHHRRRVLQVFCVGKLQSFCYTSSNSCQFICCDKLYDLLWTHSFKVCVIRFNLVFSSHIGFFFSALLYFNDSRQLFVDCMHQCIQLYCIYDGWQKKRRQKGEKKKQLKQETRWSFEKQTSAKVKWLCRAPRHSPTSNKILNWKIDKADAAEGVQQKCEQLSKSNIIWHSLPFGCNFIFSVVSFIKFKLNEFFSTFDAATFLSKWSFHFGWVIWARNKFHSQSNKTQSFMERLKTLMCNC